MTFIINSESQNSSFENQTRNTKKVVAISGGFDPIHIGHVRLLEAGKKLGDYLVVILNNDNWLQDKKGFVFMPEFERKEILEALACVDAVLITKHLLGDSDKTVVRELKELKPNIFANGGDAIKGNELENKLCSELNIALAFGIGGEKIKSSSQLALNLKNQKL